MLLRNTWYPALWGQELACGQLLPRTVAGEPVVFFRQADRKAAALADLCPHRLVPLHLGRMTEAGSLRCAYHGLEFGPDGRCARNPHGAIPPSMKVRHYPVVERHSIVWIWMGDREADEGRIPDFSLMEDRQDGLGRDRSYLHLQANYQLVADNLLDLSHANYLHEGILGLPEHSNAKVTVQQEGRTVTCKRFMPNVPVARLHDLMFRRDGAPIDMWNEVRWEVPGCLVLTHGFARPGGAEPFQFSAVHLLTPESDSTTHYSYGIVRTPALNDEAAVSREVAQTRRYVFEEQDRLVLEAQQGAMKRHPAAKPVMLTVDAASMRARRLMQELVNADQD